MKIVTNFKYKNIKLTYYMKNVLLLLLPRKAYQLRLKSELSRLSRYDREYVLSRVDYYNKSNDDFEVSNQSLNLTDFKK
ncbi:MAG: hypothetical protein ACI935_002783, partial [Moritella dasanensis]